MKHTYNKQELMKEVKNRTDIGMAYAKMQLGFIKWLVKEAGGKR